MSSEKLRGAKSAYDVARYALAQMGVHTADQAYAALPEMLPRTVRRIFERGDDLMDSEKDLKNTPVQVDVCHLGTITAKAKEAGVSLRAAISAVMRFGNPVDRVERVLDDLRALKKSPHPARNPSGLFVTAMRTGEDVKLPDVVQDKRDAKPKEHPPLRVGEWVRWNLEWMRVMSVTAVSALLSPSGDERDAYKAAVEGLLHLPRRPHPAG